MFVEPGDDFVAFLTCEPFGVLALNARTNEMRLFSFPEWKRERNGLKQHYRDMAAGRVHRIDHLEFCAVHEPSSWSPDEIGRSVMRLPLGAILRIAGHAPNGKLNVRYFRKVFGRNDADRIMTALTNLRLAGWAFGPNGMIRRWHAAHAIV